MSFKRLENSSWSDEMRATNMVVDCGQWRNCTKIDQTPGANVIIPAITSITGIVGNVIAIIVLQISTRREQTRTVFYVLVAGLAWTDLSGIIFTTWPVIIVYAYGDWPGGTSLCNYHAFAMISFALITPCIVCTMALERYVGIRHGYFYKSHVNRPRARLVLLLQWIIVLLAAAFPLFGLGRYSKQYPGTWCFLDMHPTNIGDTIYACTVAIINLIMIFLIIICNIVVAGSLFRMRYKRTHVNSPAFDKHQHRSRKQREIEIQMVILLVGITVVFTICWAPFMFQILINQFRDNGGDLRRDILTVRLASVNQVLDPWVYILFRKGFFKKCWSCAKTLCWTRRRNLTSVYSSHSDLKMAPIFIPLHSPTGEMIAQSLESEEHIKSTIDDSGTESARGELSFIDETPILETGIIEIQQQSWCCQYYPKSNRTENNCNLQSSHI